MAFATRIVTFGNPASILDDQFYLLAGDAMRHGRWPYTDVWDRKPPGLFALFAAIAAIGNGSFVAMQVIATLFAAATAFVIFRVARLYVAPEPALSGAIAYLLLLPSLGGQSGQSPVFYNLPMASAAWLLLSEVKRDASPRASAALGAMILCGIALSIKTVAAVEGTFFGMAFLYLMWRHREPLPKIVVLGAGMIAMALLPMAIFFLAYALTGPSARDAFIYANLVSIFQKEGVSGAVKLVGLEVLLIQTLPLLALAGIGLWQSRRSTKGSLSTGMLRGWLVAAALGYVAVPFFFDHYALPLVAPLCVASTLALALPSGRLYFAGLAFYALTTNGILDWRGNQAQRRDFAALTMAVDKARQGGCIYLTDGPVWLYRSTGACSLTRYVFPQHLNFLLERNALGVDPAAEMRRVLGRRPAVIVTQADEASNHNPVTQSLLNKALKNDYRPVFELPESSAPLLRTLIVWQRRDVAWGQR